MTKLAYYRDVLGFDHAEHVPFTRRYRIRCGQCEALVINGIPTHETGCPNTPRRCRECGNMVPTDQTCCAD